MIITAVIIILLGICVYFVIRLDKKMKSQFGEEHLSDYALNSKAEALANEAVWEDAPQDVSQELAQESSLLVAQALAKSQAALPVAVQVQDTTPVALTKCTGLFSADELRFWTALQEGLEGRWILFPKQSVLGLVTSGREMPAVQAAGLAELHVDVLLCQPYTYTPVGAIILVPDTHQIDSETLKYRETLASVCDSIQLPLLKFVQAEEYSPLAVAARILKVLGTSSPMASAKPVLTAVQESSVSQPGTAVETGTVQGAATVTPPEPACPQCQGLMQERKVKSGPHAGREVWACVKYPVCKGVLVQR